MSGGSPGSDSAQRGLEAFANIDVPTVESQQLQLANPEYIGDYQAQLQNAINQGPSALSDIATDPRLQSAQMNALNELAQVGQSGMTPAEKAALDESRRASAGEAQAKSAQVLSDFARRGMGGSGNELAAQLQNAQSSADRQAQGSDALLQQQQTAKLAALQNSANLAGNMQNQSFNQQANVANAKDAIARFNAQNQQSVQGSNVNAANQAGLRNLSEKQRIGEAGTNTQNQQQQYNKGLIQQNFNNQMQRAGGEANQYNQISAAQRAGAANQGNMTSNLINTGTRLGAAYMTGGGSEVARAAAPGSASGGDFTQGEEDNWLNSDKRGKTNIKPVDMSDFLDDLKAKKYDYKDPANGVGKQYGVMAQDVEKEMPQLIEHDQTGSKHINAVKAVGPILASLSDIHERLKQFEHLIPEEHKDK